MQVMDWDCQAQYKRTSNFISRADPFVTGNRGLIDFLPPMARVNTYRLTSRYAPATQELDEEAIQIDARYAVNKKLSFLGKLFPHHPPGSSRKSQYL